MRQTSIPFLAVLLAGLLSSSALWQAFGEHTMPPQTAVVRFAVCLGVAWGGLLLLKEFAMPNLGRTADPTDPVAEIRRNLGLDDLTGYTGGAVDTDEELLDEASADAGAPDGRTD